MLRSINSSKKLEEKAVRSNQKRIADKWWLRQFLGT